MQLTAHVIVQQAKPGPAQQIECVENALPEDAELVRIAQLPERWLTLYAVLCSEQFALVEPGEVIPLLPDPVFRSVRRSTTAS
jgi:hypothetical protein